ncbi:uncharacterized protein N0V89_000366 [Didymosphaeria variabile]|uniref:DUF159-domain-containing protein n=1 Tax=Didymosphaeria variabile TaxID=1932322 RepID=A0A9W9CFT1_9PLEO|nr:uncharacterized protein N0V89_000366 [Didymosphaeria variabile]KAJ4359810.1 hypothetical protein N0V89_000366 [Didymosphaeria variabile]
MDDVVQSLTTTPPPASSPNKHAQITSIMCGRYALALRPSEVRQQLERSQMPVDDAPDDEDVRQSYNFAPGYHGLVYRADGPDFGTSTSNDQHDQEECKHEDSTSAPAAGNADDTKYKLQAMKWGLVPFWTKRNPDYGSMMKTINCRDDSLYEDRGMWTSMKKKKRCIVVAQGFYEWLKKNNGREKIPHFTKRKDGQLMCFAGLYDCVQFDDTEEKLYTYAVITTDSNKQLKFLHDRMPVILDNGSEAIKTWLDPDRTEWSTDLQTLLKPYDGELECYPVSKDVGKVGNNSPQFVVPVNSAANKSNIANFFGNQQKMAKAKKDEGIVGKLEHDDGKATNKSEIKIEKDANEPRETTNQIQGSEDNAPLPVPVPISPSRGEGVRGIKRERSEAEDDGDTASGTPQQKRRTPATPAPGCSQSPQKSGAKAPAKKGTRSATSNGSAAKARPSNQRRIESFFAK